jgi:uncharacterized phiE125 gp8 family phage protein
MADDFVDVQPTSWPTNAEPPWRHGVEAHEDLVTPPTSEPITLDDAIVHLRALNTNEDDYIDRLCSVVRRAAEFYTRRAIMPQTWALVMDRFPRRHGWGASFGLSHSPLIRVGHPPVTSIVSITYVDVNGAPQTLDPSQYEVDLPKGPYAGYARIRTAPGVTWPDTMRHVFDAVRVTFTAGYLDTSLTPPVPDVPEDLVHGMLLLMGELYKTRSLSTTTPTPALISARWLWSPYRVY